MKHRTRTLGPVASAIVWAIYWIVLAAPTVAVAIVFSQVEPIAGLLRSALDPLNEAEDRYGRGLGNALMLVVVLAVGISLTLILGQLLDSISKRSKRK